MAATVGFLRTVRLAWMNKAAELVAQGKSPGQIREELNEYLAIEIQSATTLRKTRDILMSTWVAPSDELARIRKAALGVFSHSGSSRYAAQYCMLLAAYPVIADLCGLIGKLSTMQDDFTTSWLKEKMYETWGERETIADSLKYALQSLRGLDVLERPKIGTYNIKAHKVESAEVVSLILATILHLKGRAYYEVGGLTQIPQMFPFQYAISLEWLHNSPDYVLGNHGGKMTVAAKN